MGENLLVNAFAIFALVPILLALVAGGMRFGSALRPERILVILLAIEFVGQCFATTLWWYQMNNLFILHLLTPIEFLFLAYYFSYYVSKGTRTALRGLALVFIVFAVIDFYYFQSISSINALVKGVECVLMIGISLIIWVRIMRESDAEKLLRTPLFWINAAVLIYFSSNCLLFIYSEFVISSEQFTGLVLWGMHLFFMTIYYLFISIGLWKIQPK